MAYAVGFCMPLAILIGTYPVDGATAGERGWRRRSTESIVVTLGNALKYVRAAAVLASAAAITAALSGVVQ